MKRNSPGLQQSIPGPTLHDEAAQDRETDSPGPANATESEAQRAISVSRRRYEQVGGALWELPFLAIAGVDERGRVLTANRQLWKLLGRPCETIDLLHCTPSEDHPQLKGVLTRAAAGSTESPVVEHRLRRSDGSEIWVQSCFSHAEDSDGVRLWCMMKDITAWKRAEADCAEAAERFRLVVENSPQAVIMANAKGSISHVNMETEVVFDFVGRELLEKSIDCLIPGLTGNPHWLREVHLLRALESRTVSQIFEAKARRRDGTEFFAEITLSPMHMGGQPLILASITDISARKRTEQSMQDSLREKETLLKEVHHRVKNNLQMVSSLLQLQTDYIEDPQALAVFREGQNRVRSMALIHQKLYQSSSLSRVEIAGYIDGLVAILRSSFVPPDQTIEFTNRASGVEIPIDAAIPLGLIVNELATNALKHAFPDNRPGRIEIMLDRQPGVPGGLEFQIRDNGKGLPADFDWRSAPSLGLRLVRLLSDQLEGTATMRSDRGTHFSLQFIVATEGRMP